MTISQLSLVIRGLLLTRRTADCRQNKNAPKSKVTKCIHFYRKWKPQKPLSCFNKWHTLMHT